MVVRLDYLKLEGMIRRVARSDSLIGGHDPDGGKIGLPEIGGHNPDGGKIGLSEIGEHDPDGGKI